MLKEGKSPLSLVIDKDLSICKVECLSPPSSKSLFLIFLVIASSSVRAALTMQSYSYEVTMSELLKDWLERDQS